MIIGKNYEIQNHTSRRNNTYNLNILKIIMESKEGKKIIHGKVIEINDYSKIARLKGEDKKPEQVIKILLDEIPDEELGKLMLVEKVSLVIGEGDK